MLWAIPFSNPSKSKKLMICNSFPIPFPIATWKKSSTYHSFYKISPLISVQFFLLSFFEFVICDHPSSPVHREKDMRILLMNIERKENIRNEYKIQMTSYAGQWVISVCQWPRHTIWNSGKRYSMKLWTKATENLFDSICCIYVYQWNVERDRERKRTVRTNQKESETLFYK